MATATVRPSSQDEYATAVFWASTSPVTFLTEKASLKTDLPSWVLVATAVLSWLWAETDGVVAARWRSPGRRGGGGL
jgi:hypothetical protein